MAHDIRLHQIRSMQISSLGSGPIEEHMNKIMVIQKGKDNKLSRISEDLWLTSFFPHIFYTISGTVT